LREEIFTLCLKSDESGIELDEELVPGYFQGVFIRDDNRIPIPALLHTCRQIRGEAAAVWFKINRFLIYIWELDATLLHEWTEFCSKLRPAPRKRVYGSAHYPIMRIFSVRDQYKWANVVQWCQWVHEGKLEPPPRDKLSGEEGRLVAGALGIAKNHRGRPWSECEESIACLRLVLKGWRGKIC
jgi:hypothetical protein